MDIIGYFGGNLEHSLSRCDTSIFPLPTLAGKRDNIAASPLFRPGTQNSLPGQQGYGRGSHRAWQPGKTL